MKIVSDPIYNRSLYAAKLQQQLQRFLDKRYQNCAVFVNPDDYINASLDYSRVTANMIFTVTQTRAIDWTDPHVKIVYNLKFKDIAYPTLTALVEGLANSSSFVDGPINELQLSIPASEVDSIATSAEFSNVDLQKFEIVYYAAEKQPQSFTYSNQAFTNLKTYLDKLYADNFLLIAGWTYYVACHDKKRRTYELQIYKDSKYFASYPMSYGFIEPAEMKGRKLVEQLRSTAGRLLNLNITDIQRYRGLYLSIYNRSYIIDSINTQSGIITLIDADGGFAYYDSLVSDTILTAILEPDSIFL